MKRSIAAPESTPFTPKHQRVKEALRRQILDGKFAPGSKLPPDSEMYKRFRVNRLTVVRALTDLARDGLIIRRRGSGTYVAGKGGAKSAGKAQKLGVVWRWSVSPNQMLNNTMGMMTLGAVAALGLDPMEARWPMVNDYETTRAIWENKKSGLCVECLGESGISQVRYPPIVDVRAGRFSGLLAIGIFDDAYLDQLLELGIPVVLVDILKERLHGKLDQVYIDPQGGFQAAVRHFAQAGLRRIHFVAAQISLPAPSVSMSVEEIKAYRGNRMRVDPDSYLRFCAYKQAMDECGLEVKESSVHLMSPAYEPVGALAVRLAQLPEAERPEAVICSDCCQADRIIAHFTGAGLSLKGAGALSAGTAKHALPIRVDLKEMGASAIDLLQSRIQRPLRPCFRVGIPMTFGGPGTAEAKAMSFAT